MAFSASEAAISGFGLIRREPRTFVIWGALAAAVGLLTFGVMYATGATQMMAQLSQARTAGGNPMAIMGGMFGIFAIAMVIGLLTYSVVVCGVYRAILRPEEKGFARLRLGADEGRMALLIILMGLIWIAAVVVLSIAIGILTAVVGLSAAQSHGAGGATGGIVMAMLVAYLVMIFAAVWFGVQFSMAAPATFHERRLVVFGSWKVVRGHFWGLLGCFLLVTVFTLLLYVVIGSLQMALNLAVGAPNPFAAMMHPGEAPDLSGFFKPGAIAVALLVNFISVCFYPIWFAPQAAAYAAITGAGGAKAADAFD
jgi:hypothetical protein